MDDGEDTGGADLEVDEGAKVALMVLSKHASQLMAISTLTPRMIAAWFLFNDARARAPRVVRSRLSYLEQYPLDEGALARAENALEMTVDKLLEEEEQLLTNIATLATVIGAKVLGEGAAYSRVLHHIQLSRGHKLVEHARREQEKHRTANKKARGIRVKKTK